MKAVLAAAAIAVAATGFAASPGLASPVIATVTNGGASTPIPPHVGIAIVAGSELAKELMKPKPFCKALRVFNKKKKC